MIPFPSKTLNTEQRQLLRWFDQLNPRDRESVCAFAEFLASRSEVAEPSPVDLSPQVPQDIPRPAKESVVGAIRRLSKSYYMLERQDMLNETASLMAAHVMQGRSAADVVDELEVVFRSHYERYLQDHPS